MTIEEKVQALLVAAAGVTALCPAARISVQADRQTQARPYIVHFQVSVDPMHMHVDGIVPLKNWMYQVSVFSDTYSTGRALASAVVTALNGTHGDATLFWRNQQYFDDAINEVRVHHFPLTFEVFEAL